MKIEEYVTAEKYYLIIGSNCAKAGAAAGLIKSKSTKEHSSRQLNRLYPFSKRFKVIVVILDSFAY
jgi:hypothetical protein